jgi:hypothetical protein
MAATATSNPSPVRRRCRTCTHWLSDQQPPPGAARWSETARICEQGLPGESSLFSTEPDASCSGWSNTSSPSIAGAKYGVLSFSYDTFPVLAQQLGDHGCFTTNLGDNVQTIASRRLLSSIGIGDDDIVAVDRDTLPTYAGGQVSLVMNGVFREQGFPIPDLITPIMMGFAAEESVISANRDWLGRHGPIGCRDHATARLLEACGIAAFTSGCVTLTLPRRTAEPASPKLLVVYGSGAGALPPTIFKHVPPELMDTAEFVFHRLPADEYPPSPAHQRLSDAYEEFLLRQYRDTATLVLTSLHHVAAPCMAMGIPTIICRNWNDWRFSLLEDFVPINTPERFAGIDWSPRPVDVSPVRDRFTAELRSRIGR